MTSAVRHAAARRRSRQAVAPPRLVKFVVTDEELGELDAAAARAELTGEERDAIYAHAAGQAATATEHIRRCSATDPARAADAAWAAADTLHVAARALRSPSLRRAADTYRRAARAPYGRIPRRTRAGERLRAAARAVALTAAMTGDPGMAPVALIARLTELAAAVAALREAQ